MPMTFHFSSEDLAEIRFSLSPLWELAASIRAAGSPSKHALHLRWFAESKAATADLDLVRIRTLFGGDCYIPDFLTPPPEVPFPEFEEELARIRATPEDQVRKDITVWAGMLDEGPKVLADRILEDPDRELGLVIDEMRAYWNATLARHWPRIRALLEGDVLYRARKIALEGAEGLFSDLNQQLSWYDGVLEYGKEHKSGQVDLGGRGLLLIPAVFSWPGVLFQYEEPWQPTICYSPRGVAGLWEPQDRESRGAIAELIGDTRADILRTLEIPMTTTELATKLRVTPAAVSQQLAVLRRAGVVDADRVGRGVYSRRTELGESLLALLD